MQPFKEVVPLINHKLIGLIENLYSSSTCLRSRGEFKEPLVPKP